MGLDLFALAGAIMDVNSFMQDAVAGVVIVLTIVIDYVRTKSK